MLVAQNFETTLQLLDYRSDSLAVLAEFKVTKKYQDGVVLDCVKLPSEEPIYAIRSEGSVFLYNLRTKMHLNLASEIGIEYPTRQIYVTENEEGKIGVVFARSSYDNLSKRLVVTLFFKALD